MNRLVIVLVLFVLATPASADSDADGAQRLAAEATDDFVAGRFAEACPKLETSLRLRPDLRPLGLLAACYEKLGRLATAWRTFKEVRRQAETVGDRDLAAAAAVHVARLEPQLARLTIAIAARVDGLTVTLAGRTLLANELDTPLELDAGSYKIVATAPGKPTWQTEIGIRDGKTERVEVPRLAPAAPTLPERMAREPAPPPPPPASKRRMIGVATAGVGTAAVIAGVVIGLSARSKFSDAKGLGCDDDGRCPDAAGVELVDDAHAKATLGTIFIGAGAAMVTAGVVVFLTAPRSERTITPVVGRGSAGLVVRGRF